MADDSQDRRSQPRVESRFVVSYRPEAGQSSFNRSLIKDISLTGILFTSSCEYPKGTKLNLELRLPISLEPIKLIGSVAGTKKVSGGEIYDIHVEFIPVEEKDKEIIRESVDFLLKKKKKWLSCFLILAQAIICSNADLYLQTSILGYNFYRFGIFGYKYKLGKLIK